MAVSIQIVVDDDQRVRIVEAGHDDLKTRLVEILDGWKQQATEPCSAGQKCRVLQQWIAQVERVITEELNAC